MRKISIRIKIMLWYTLLTAALLAIALPILYGTLSGSLQQDQEALLRSAAGQIASHLELEDGKPGLGADADLPDGSHYQITTTENQILSSDAQLWDMAPPFHPDEIYSHTRTDGVWLYLDQDLELDGEIDARLRVCRSMAPVEQSLEQIRLIMLLAVPAFLSLAVFGSYLLAVLALRPIQHITDTAAALGESGDLSRRITGIESRDEVGRLAGAFNAMLERLEDSFQREKRFTSDASHELRTPVSVVMAYAEDLSAHAPDPQTRAQAEAILVENRRMHTIIAQLLALTRGREGKYRLELEEIRLGEMVSDILAELAEDADARGITLRKAVPAELTITADQSLLTQLLLNLVENGIKYGREGGFVAVEAREEQSKVLLLVKDDGIGIGPDDQLHIFERFYRADKARDRTGSGLGLSIVKWIVELHHGTISVESAPESGTVFTVYF